MYESSLSLCRRSLPLILAALAATAVLAWRNFHPLLILLAGGVAYALSAGLMG